jgi:hypothetical protein
MNDRPTSPGASGLNAMDRIPSCVPIIPHAAFEPGMEAHSGVTAKKNGTRMQARKEPALVKDQQFPVEKDGIIHIISESYFYKTEPYYTILRHELDGIPVLPTSSAVLDAYVVPVCLERAGLAGIPVCEWGISQGYAPLPSILYGLNYFANASDYFVVRDTEKEKETVRHITNMGKYPFCYQKVPDNAEIRSCVAIFGRTTSGSELIDTMASQVYNLFAIPLVTMVLVNDGGRFLLSSLTQTRYSQLSADERALLSAYITHQEFL